jgi:hypothetical protein
MAHHETAKAVTDVAAVATTVGTIAEVLPSIAAIFTIIWTGFRIYETDTVQSWLGKKKDPQ